MPVEAILKRGRGYAAAPIGASLLCSADPWLGRVCCLLAAGSRLGIRSLSHSLVDHSGAYARSQLYSPEKKLIITSDLDRKSISS